MARQRHLAVSLGILSSFFSSTSTARTQPSTPIPIYGWATPEGPNTAAPETYDVVFDHAVIRNVTRPTLTPVLPDGRTAIGAAVIVVPGGGNMWLAIDNEGYAVAQWLAAHGIAAFVLKYRLAPTPANPKELAVHLRTKGGAEAANASTWAAGATDVRAAIGLLREHAHEWHVDPRRIGVIGFSAGARNALEATLTSDPSTLPDFLGLLYGPLASRQLPANAPPLFAAIAADDPLESLSDLGLITAWQRAGHTVEFHLYQGGNHGFGMETRRTTSDLWPVEFLAWLRSIHELQPSAETIGRRSN